MKVKRQKKVHQNLGFFCNNYGFRKPYQILIDSTFCCAAKKYKVNIREQLPKYFEGDVKLLTTQCVIVETEKMGPQLYGVAVIVKQFAIHKCGHDLRPVPAQQCLQGMLGATNPQRYIIASQDIELRVYARNIPGVPLLYLYQHTPTLEHPSESSKHRGYLNRQGRCELNKFEEKELISSKQQLSIMAELVPVTSQKKKPKGPNPLSCQKKRKIANPLQPAPGSGKGRKRKRVKLALHVQEELKLLQTSEIMKSLE